MHTWYWYKTSLYMDIHANPKIKALLEEETAETLWEYK